MTELRYVQLRAPTREEQGRYAEADRKAAGAIKQNHGSSGEPVIYSARNRYRSPPMPLGDALSSGSRSAVFVADRGRNETKPSLWTRLLRSVFAAKH